MCRASRRSARFRLRSRLATGCSSSSASGRRRKRSSSPSSLAERAGRLVRDRRHAVGRVGRARQVPPGGREALPVALDLGRCRDRDLRSGRCRVTPSRRLAFLPAMLAGLTLTVAVATPGARAYHTNFQGSCRNESFPTSGVTRGQARIYAEIGANEGSNGAVAAGTTTTGTTRPAIPPKTRRRVARVATARASPGSRGSSGGVIATPGSPTTTACRTSTGRTPPRLSRAAPVSQNRCCPNRPRSKWTPWHPSNHIGMIYQPKRRTTPTGSWRRNARRAGPGSGAVRIAGTPPTAASGVTHGLHLRCSLPCFCWRSRVAAEATLRRSSSTAARRQALRLLSRRSRMAS